MVLVRYLRYNLLEDQNSHKDNTVGSRSKTSLAYIAGFLDGDGSLMLQIKKRKDGLLKRRFMSTICFYQDSRHEEPLHWIREVLGIGYISRRKDGMSELRINGFDQAVRILEILIPYIRFKKLQAKALLDASKILASCKISKLSRKQFEQIVGHILIIQKENYITKKKRSLAELKKFLGLTP